MPVRVVLLAPRLTLAACLAAGCTAGPPAAKAPALPTALPTRPAPSPTGPPDGWSRPTADPVYPGHGDPDVDVGSYRLALRWTPDRRILAGTADLTIRAVRPTRQVRLDLARAYAVDEVLVDGAPARGVLVDGARASGAADADRLVVALDRELPAGQRFDLRVRYHGTPAPTAFPGVRNDIPTIGAHVTGDGGVWAMSEPFGAFTWFPCVDQPSDKALLDVEITVPPGWAGVSSGRFTGAVPAGDGAVTYRWHSAEPIATYLVAFAIDRFDRIDDTGPHGLPITYWVRPADRATLEPTLRRTPELLRWLEARLGRYPFSSAGVVVVPATSALETQSMVTLAPIPGAEAVPVLLHELAHHWFGDAVTPVTWRDVWLSEGFATYLQMLFAVDRQGARADDVVRRWRHDDGRLRAEAGPPGRYRADRFAARNVYYGPALMLHELRRQLGDAHYLALLHDWVQHHLHSNQDRASFQRWLNAYTGRDFTALVDRWLDAPVTPA